MDALNYLGTGFLEVGDSAVGGAPRGRQPRRYARVREANSDALFFDGEVNARQTPTPAGDVPADQMRALVEPFGTLTNRRQICFR